MRNKALIFLPILFSVINLSCEIPTSLSIEVGNPPRFILAGSGQLSRLMVRGHKKLREAEGPDSSACWYIKPADKNNYKHIEHLSPITYGKVPTDYVQVYPEQGEAIELNENETYYIEVDTINAPRATGWFLIRDGKVRFAEYEYELTDKKNS